VAVGATKEIPLTDPNVAVHSGIKNPLIAAHCGFTTAWSLESTTAINGGALVIQLDPASLANDKSKVEVTAFRRLNHTHPLSYHDRLTSESGNGALASLNDSSGSPRYRAILHQHRNCIG